MSELKHTHKIILSEGQKRKLRIAYKKRRTTVIGLTNKNISSGHGDNILLNDVQNKAIKKSIKNKTGLRLIMSYDQLIKNKEGGLLKEMLEFVESSVPGGKRFISPLVRKQIAPILKDEFLPWLKKLIDNELDTIIDPKGAGLKRCINEKLDNLLKNRPNKKKHTNK